MKTHQQRVFAPQIHYFCIGGWGFRSDAQRVAVFLSDRPSFKFTSIALLRRHGEGELRAAGAAAGGTRVAVGFACLHPSPESAALGAFTVHLSAGLGETWRRYGCTSSD